jgi:IS5 family transposase
MLYPSLLRITRAVLREADAAVAALPARPRPRIQHLAGAVQSTCTLVRQVVAQTRARVLRGDTHYPNKVVSLFEPHSEIIRKGNWRSRRSSGAS